MNSSNQESCSSQIKDKAQNAMNDLTGANSSTSTPAQNLSFFGAEQDRYASHFGLGNDGLQRLKQAAAHKGSGAEQDVHAEHFSLLDAQKVQQAKDAMFNSGYSGAEQDRYQARFGLGNDGLERVKALVSQKGVGAEQERYEAHFGLDDAKVERALDSLAEGWAKK